MFLDGLLFMNKLYTFFKSERNAIVCLFDIVHILNNNTLLKLIFVHLVNYEKFIFLRGILHIYNIYIYYNETKKMDHM